MYQLSVPVMNATVHKGTREEYLRQFRAAGVRRVFLVPDTDMVTGTVRSFDLLKENIAYFSANGLLVGIWVGENAGLYVCKLSNASASKDIGGDGTHPNIESSKKMAEELSAFLGEILEK